MIISPLTLDQQRQFVCSMSTSKHIHWGDSFWSDSMMKRPKFLLLVDARPENPALFEMIATAHKMVQYTKPTHLFFLEQIIVVVDDSSGWCPSVSHIDTFGTPKGFLVATSQPVDFIFQTKPHWYLRETWTARQMSAQQQWACRPTFMMLSDSPERDTLTQDSGFKFWSNMIFKHWTHGPHIWGLPVCPTAQVWFFSNLAVSATSSQQPWPDQKGDQERNIRELCDVD